MRMKLFLPVAILGLSLPACADEVVLRNGATFQGVVREDGDRVVLVVDFGTVSFKRSEIKSIVRSASPITELEDKVKAAKDAAGYYEAGLWARDRGLATRAGEIFEKALALDPDHAGARKAAGYEFFEGRWLRGDDLRTAQGYVKVGREWLKRETAEKLKEDEKQLLIEQERNATAERLAQVDREVQLARLGVERERIELERERTQHYYYWRPWVVLPCRCRNGHHHGPAAPVVVNPPTVVVNPPTSPAPTTPPPAPVPTKP